MVSASLASSTVCTRLGHEVRDLHPIEIIQFTGVLTKGSSRSCRHEG